MKTLFFRKSFFLFSTRAGAVVKLRREDALFSANLMRKKFLVDSMSISQKQKYSTSLPRSNDEESVPTVQIDSRSVVRPGHIEESEKANLEKYCETPRKTGADSFYLGIDLNDSMFLFGGTVLGIVQNLHSSSIAQAK
jgi:hypothetical protein